MSEPEPVVTPKLANVLARISREGIAAGEPIRVVTAGHGTLNEMLAIEYADGSRYYWKHFLPHPDWPWVQSPTDRMRVELRALQAFRDALPPEIRLPAASIADETEHCLLLSDACPKGGKNWQEAFLEGEPEISRELAERLGAAFGQLARFTPDRPLRADFDADHAHWEKWLRLRTLATLQHDPPISHASKRALQELYEEACACTGPCLLHVDLVPKNIMIASDSAGLVDFELATAIGDAAFDLGFFLGHVGLFLVNRIHIVTRTWTGILDRIAESYLSLARMDSVRQQRVMRYAGAAILYRVVGATRMPFLDPRATERQLVVAECLLTSSATLQDYAGVLATKARA